MTPRPRAVVLLATAVVVALAGYGVADAADVVPGPLTTAPRPTPAAPFPSVGPVTASAAAVLPTPASAGGTTADAVAARLGPAIAASGLPGLSVSVADTSGRTLYSRAASTRRTPASTAKLLTAAAALDALGPDHRFTTSVVAGATSGDEAGDTARIVLVGGGDVLLGTRRTARSGTGAARADTAADGRASLADLASDTAARLRAAGRHSVRLGVDDTLFTGASSHPGWSSDDVSGGFVSPIDALAVHAGRTAWPADSPRSTDPALDAGRDFAALLEARGITVEGAIARGAAPSGATRLAAVTSAPLSDVVRYMLLNSDNVVADALGRSVAIADGLPASFAGASRAVVARVAGLGVDTTGLHLADTSGLAAGTKVTADQLTEALAAAAGGDHPRVTPLLAALPVAGVSGTLEDRYRTGSARAGAGLVRAKTGTLTGVMALAGTVVDADGRQLVVALISNGIPAAESLEARAAGDRVLAALTGV